MPHEHKLTKIKKDNSFECDTSFMILINVYSGTILIAGVNLYPGDKAWYCQKNEKVERLIKENKLKIVETHEGKPKIKKIKEEKFEESSVTVAETEAKASVQWDSSEDIIAPLIEQ